MKNDSTTQSIEDIDIIALGKQYDPKWDSSSEWIGDGYETCEKIAFDLKFGKGKYNIRYRHEDNDYQGETRILIQNTSEPDESQYHDWFICNYEWGSCSGCDTLQGNGVIAAVRMILESIKSC